MGKKLDALLGRSFKINKFKSLISLALTRLSILKNQRQARLSQAISDVTELLKLGHHENAYHRIDQVIKDQNTLDVLFFIHGYFTLCLDRVHLFEHNRDCPEELLEAVSGLLFAASRIGEFPELQEIRNVLISRFGKDLAARSIELRRNCSVNLKIIQKLSTRHPPKEVRMKVLKEIAAENNIVLKLEDASTSTEEWFRIQIKTLVLSECFKFGSARKSLWLKEKVSFKLIKSKTVSQLEGLQTQSTFCFSSWESELKEEIRECLGRKEKTNCRPAELTFLSVTLSCKKTRFAAESKILWKCFRFYVFLLKIVKLVL